jgi:hypothetical protein
MKTFNGFTIDESLKFSLKKYASYISYEEDDNELTLILEDNYDIDAMKKILNVLFELELDIDMAKTILQGGRSGKYHSIFFK